MQSGVPGLQFCVFARVASIFKRGLLCWYNLETAFCTIATSLLNLHNTLRCSTLSWNHINRKTFPTLILRRLIFPELSALPSLSLSLCLFQRTSGAICRPRSIPKHWGSQRCYFSKLAPSTSCRGCAAAVQGKVGNFWGPVPLVPPSLSPASLGAALWGCHNCGLYNMGYCWRRLVTVDEAFKEASPLMVSVKILGSRSKGLAPRRLQTQ